MGRPKGRTDIKKRKRKVILTGKQERILIQDYLNGMVPSDIYKKYNITKYTFSALKKRRNISSLVDHSKISSWDTIESKDFITIKNVSGIYVIYFIWKYNINNINKQQLINNIKIYIGSSVSIGRRLGAHENELKNNKHYNKNLQKLYNNNEYSVHYAIIERCDENQIMQREAFYLNSYNKCSLLNTWKAIREEDVRPWLTKALFMESYNKHYNWNNNSLYNGTPCKESNYVHKSGYGTMRVKIDDTTKSFSKHRIAYWEKHGEYPELIRHLCNNSKCYNPEHLEKGNHRENSLDNRTDFPKQFVAVWLKYQGDLYKISRYFEKMGRWKPNQSWNGYRVSYSVYDWEKKLDLRNKYPEVSRNRISNLRKQQAQRGSNLIV